MRVEIRDSDTHKVLLLVSEDPSKVDPEEPLLEMKVEDGGEMISYFEDPKGWMRGLPRALRGNSRIYVEVTP